MATATRRKRRPTHLSEQAPLGKPDRVDREAGVIHGVKVLGLVSRNGPKGTGGSRRYTPEALAKAVPLYEGASVRVNHPKRGADQRDANDAVGWLENVRQGADGCLYGDLHLLLEHEITARVLEAAEKNPRIYGLSHNADGDARREGPDEVVREILEVRSVDLVLDPATTGGLFEGRPMLITLGKLLEAVTLSAPRRRLVTRLFEADVMDPELPVDAMAPEAEAPAGDHMAALRSGFEGALMACVAEALDGSLDPKEALKKIKELIATHAKLADQPGKSAPPPAEVEEGEDEDDKDELEEGCGEDDDVKKKQESRDLRRENAELKAREGVRELCESLGVRPSKPLLAALVALKSDAERKALLEEVKPGQQPRPRPRTQLAESRGGAGHDRDEPPASGDTAALARWLKSGVS